MYTPEQTNYTRFKGHDNPGALPDFMTPLHRPNHIVIVDINTILLKRYAARLKNAGFTVNTTTGLDRTNSIALDEVCLMLVDISCTEDINEFFSFISLARFQGYKGKTVFTAEAINGNDIYRAALLGACDLWIKGPYLRIEKESSGVLTRRQCSPKEKMSPQSIASLGLFRTAGLSGSEIALIQKMADGFPRQCEIAAYLGKTSAYIHKMFSRIYEKLGTALAVDNPTRLAHLITLCSFFR